MKVLTYNIHGWQTPAGQPNIELVTEVIADSGADLVGLNEVFHPAPTAHGPALALLARRLGMHFAFGPTIAAAPQPAHPPYGNALLSRWPILAFAAHHLVPMTAYGQRGLLEVRVQLPNGQPFTVYVTHLDHRSEALRLEQWAAAYTWLSRDRTRPHLLIGDLNALSEADYPTPDALSRLAAYQAERGWPAPSFELMARVLKAGYVDAVAACGGGQVPTYPAQTPERRIDYILSPRLWAVAIGQCGRVISAAAQAASDHLPVYAEFVW